MPVFILLYAGAILTALYMFRLYFITFEGLARSDKAAHAHENGALMTGPLLLLSILAVVGGYHSLYPFAIVESILPDIELVAAMPNHLWMIVLGTFAWIVGAITARNFYGRVGDVDPLSEKFPTFFSLCKSKLFFDQMYGFYIKKIQDPMARFLEVMELLFISGLMVRGSAGVAALLGMLGKVCYIGKIHAYTFWFVAGTIGFLAYASGIFGN